LWKELRAKFPVGALTDCEEFLGATLRWNETEAFRTVGIDMRQYIDQICLQFQTLYPSSEDEKGKKGGTRRNYQCKSPMSDDLRCDDPEKTVPQHRNQKMIGMLLWLARVARPDISFAVSRLGTRIACWDDTCSEQLARCVGYTRFTRESVLELRVAKADAAAGFVISTEPASGAMFDEIENPPAGIEATVHTDADWRAPRSQSGFLYGLFGSGGTSVPIAWGSKKQGITADSSGSSELIASHYALREVIGLHEGFFGTAQDGTRRPLVLRADNSTVLRIARSGISRQLDLLETKPISLRIGLLRDLRELGVIRVVHVRTHLNRADALTKALEGVKMGAAVEMFSFSDYRGKQF
jgi:hypothetical protein